MINLIGCKVVLPRYDFGSYKLLSQPIILDLNITEKLLKLICTNCVIFIYNPYKNKFNLNDYFGIDNQLWLDKYKIAGMIADIVYFYYINNITLNRINITLRLSEVY